MPLSNVPSLPSNVAIVDPATGFPTPLYARWWQDSVQNAVNALLATANAQAAADTANAAAIIAQDAADLAQANSDAANAAAAAAQAQADASAAAAAVAQAQADANAREAALGNSYITPPSVLTCTPTTITIASHTRQYADGTSLAVSGGSIATTGGAGPVTNYVSYTDASRTDTTPPYVSSTAAPTQSMDVHVIGAITVPATGTATGGSGPRRPGEVSPEP